MLLGFGINETREKTNLPKVMNLQLSNCNCNCNVHISNIEVKNMGDGENSNEKLMCC